MSGKPSNQDPAEGARDIVERELERASRAKPKDRVSDGARGAAQKHHPEPDETPRGMPRPRGLLDEQDERGTGGKPRDRDKERDRNFPSAASGSKPRPR